MEAESSFFSVMVSSVMWLPSAASFAHSDLLCTISITAAFTVPVWQCLIVPLLRPQSKLGTRQMGHKISQASPAPCWPSHKCSEWAYAQGYPCLQQPQTAAITTNQCSLAAVLFIKLVQCLLDVVWWQLGPVLGWVLFIIFINHSEISRFAEGTKL